MCNAIECIHMCLTGYSCMRSSWFCSNVRHNVRQIISEKSPTHMHGRVLAEFVERLNVCLPSVQICSAAARHHQRDDP